MVTLSCRSAVRRKTFLAGVAAVILAVSAVTSIRGEPEQRQTLSTSSASIHAVNDLFGNSAVFYNNKVDHAFYVRDNGGGPRSLAPAVRQLGPPPRGNARATARAGRPLFRC